MSRRRSCFSFWTTSTGLPPLTTDLEIAPGETASIDDIVRTRFALDSGRGTLVISSPDGKAATRYLVTSRTWTPGAIGTFGQFVAAVDEHEALAKASGSANLIHIDSNPTYRCNVGLSEIAGAPTTVRVRLLNAAGEEQFSLNLSLEAHANEQFNLADKGAPRVSNGRVVVEVIDGAGSVIPYASVVDNRTGDPIFIPF